MMKLLKVARSNDVMARFVLILIFASIYLPAREEGFPAGLLDVFHLTCLDGLSCD